jgi:hypothetical protein
MKKCIRTKTKFPEQYVYCPFCGVLLEEVEPRKSILWIDKIIK